MKDNLLAPDEKTALFDWMEVRKVRENGEWYFSIVDVIAILVWNKRPSKYWTDLKNDIISQWNNEVSDFIGKLKMKWKDGIMYAVDVANTKTT